MRQTASHPSSLLKKSINSDIITNFSNNTYFTVHRRDWKDYVEDDILYSPNRSLKIISLVKADT